MKAEPECHVKTELDKGYEIATIPPRPAMRQEPTRLEQPCCVFVRIALSVNKLGLGRITQNLGPEWPGNSQGDKKNGQLVGATTE